MSSPRPEIGSEQLSTASLSVLIVRRRWELHFEYAGYDPLFDHEKAMPHVHMSSTEYSFFARATLTLPRQALRLTKHLALGHLRKARGILREAAQRYAWMTSPPDVVHIAAMDELVGTIPRIRSLFPSTPILGTIHLPPASWRAQPKESWEALACLDAIVVLSSAQKEFFLQELPTARAIFVPHGVNVAFFRPRPESGSLQDERPRVIFVGTHLRDFQILAHVIAGAIMTHSTVCFDLVIPADMRPPELLELGGRCPERIMFHDRVSSSLLLRLYQRAQVALLPLKDATANNSLMEALACGLPVIATDVGGTRDYLSEDCGVLVPPEGRELYVKHLMEMIQDAHARARLGKAARARAEQFSWERVARQMTQVYCALHSGHTM